MDRWGDGQGTKPNGGDGKKRYEITQQKGCGPDREMENPKGGEIKGKARSKNCTKKREKKSAQRPEQKNDEKVVLRKRWGVKQQRRVTQRKKSHRHQKTKISVPPK